MSLIASIWRPRTIAGYSVPPSLFRDRAEAGRKLAEPLRHERTDGQRLLVIGLPRGGVIVAAEVARILDAELDVLIVRKLGAPHQPELAVGAVGPGSVRVLDERLARSVGLVGTRLELLVDAERDEIRRREAAYRAGRPPLDLRGRTVLLVDDGLATGWTMRAAVRVARALEPKRLVVAVAVAPEGVEEMFQGFADEVISLATPEPFIAVGIWYEDFHPVSDAQVIAALARSVSGRSERGRSQHGSSQHGGSPHGSSPHGSSPHGSPPHGGSPGHPR